VQKFVFPDREKWGRKKKMHNTRSREEGQGGGGHSGTMRERRGGAEVSKTATRKELKKGENKNMPITRNDPTYMGKTRSGDLYFHCIISQARKETPGVRENQGKKRNG